MVLFAVVLGGDEEGFESGPVLEHGWAFTPFVTVFVEETCGFNVVIRPPHELRVIDHLITFGCEELAVIKLVKQGFNGGWWGPGGLSFSVRSRNDLRRQFYRTFSKCVVTYHMVSRWRNRRCHGEGFGCIYHRWS